MDLAEARKIAIAYEMTDIFRGLAERERRTWGTIQLLKGPGGPVSDSLPTVLLEAWVDAKANAWLMRLAAHHAAKLLVEVGAPVRYPDAAPNPAALVDFSLKNQALCAPILVGVVPAVANPSPP